MSDALGFALVVAAVLGLGIGLGMLVAPRLSRVTERDEEEPGDDQRG